MKLLYIFFSLFLSMQIISSAQAVTLDEADFIFDQAEALYPELFPTGPETIEAEAIGATWYARFYPSTGIYAAVNQDENGVYTLGGPWPEPTFIATVGDLLVQLGYESPGGNGENAILTAGSANCVNLTYPPQGLVAVYSGSVTADGETAQIDYTTTYTAVSETSITTVTDQTISAGGFSTMASTTSTVTNETINDWFFTKEIDSATSASLMGITSTTSVNIQFTPSLFSSPLTICEGMSWYTAEVDSNTSTNTTIEGFPGGFPTTINAPAGDYTTNIEGVGVSVTVPAGTFETVVTSSDNVEDESIETGRAVSYSANQLGGIPVKLEIFDETDTQISVIELQSVNQ